MKIKTFLTLGSLSLLFVYLAFYNGYPLVTSDTGSDILHGFELVLPNDRPLTYCLFLRLAALQSSLWLPIVVQGMLLTFLLYRLCKVLIPKANFSLSLFATVCISTIFFTSVSWYASQLMPDIFTAMLFLSILLYFFDSFRYSRYLYLFLLFSFTIMHNSNLLILLFFALVLTGYTFFQAKNYLKKAIHLVGVAVFSMFFLASLHLIGGHGFTLSRASHVFLMGKLCENGVLKKYLEENCGRKNYQLCQYKNELPKVAWAFVWNQDSPMQKMGGWDSTKTEYKSILKDLAFSPKYYPLLAYKATVHTFIQLTQIQVGDGLFPYKENSSPYWKVYAHYAHELPTYLSSKQNASNLSWTNYNLLYLIFLIISSIAVLVLLNNYPMSKQFQLAYGMLFLFLFFNAVVTANFANILARLFSRVVWLLPMLHIIYLASWLWKWQVGLKKILK